MSETSREGGGGEHCLCSTKASVWMFKQNLTTNLQVKLSNNLRRSFLHVVFISSGGSVAGP